MKHALDHIKKPDFIQLSENLYTLRFETMKLYSADYAVKKLLDESIIDYNTTVIDSSSGLYALALAMACHKYGLKCHIVASKSVDKTILCQLIILGATVEQVESSGSLKQDQDIRVAKIQKILRQRNDVYWMQQYHNNIHYLGYYEIAKQIYDEIKDKKINLIGSVGTGCSSGGIYKSLKDLGLNVKLIGVQPFGSVSFKSDHIEDPKSIIAGIGSAIHFDNLNHQLYDYIHWVDFEYSCQATVSLLKEHALFCGLSSGSAYLVAQWEAKQHIDAINIFIALDTGHRYIDSVFTNHQNQETPKEISPVLIQSTKELSIPWCYMHWNHQAFY